jgi:hydroxypyruvate isomerase
MVYGGPGMVAGLAELRQAGVEAYEFWSWQDKDLEGLLRQQEALGMRCVAFCTRGSLVDPARRPDYLSGLGESLAVARRFGADKLITQTGPRLAALPEEAQWASLLAGLRACAPLLEAAGVTLLVEPLNLLDHPDSFLTRMGDAFRLVEEVDSPWVKILFDIYHTQVTEGDILRRVQQGLGKIGHFHCAGNPGRGNITQGEIRYEEVFRGLAGLGYPGWVGLEGRLQDPAADLLAATELFKRSERHVAMPHLRPGL